MGLNDINSLAHTKWNCKYHIVFAPKYRRKVFFGEKKVAIGKILRQLCEWKGIHIIEGEVCPDHVHMLVEIPPKMAGSSFMGYIKGLFVVTGKNTSRIAEYIRQQLSEDKLGEQMSMPETDRLGNRKK